MPFGLQKRAAINVILAWMEPFDLLLTNTAPGLRGYSTAGSRGDASIIITLAADYARSHQVISAHARRILEPSDGVEGEP